MSNELIKKELDFTPDQIALIKQQIAPNANQSELQMFLHQCKRTGLDPMVRQIYCIHRGGKMTIQTSIDGFRVVAERSGVYAGQDEPVFVEDEKGNIINCKVTVYKFSPSGVRYPAAVGVAYWSEYAQQSPMWNKMKHTMIAKCAEALALRKAFPQDLSGLYTSEEMNQADAPVNGLVSNGETIDDIPTEEEKQLLKSLVYNTNLSDEEKESTMIFIDNIRDYKTFEKLEFKLQDRQLSIDEIPNPNQKDLNKHLKKVMG